MLVPPQQGQQGEGQEAYTVAACEWFDDLAAAELDPTVDVLEREAAKLMQQVGCAAWQMRGLIHMRGWPVVVPEALLLLGTACCRQAMPALTQACPAAHPICRLSGSPRQWTLPAARCQMRYGSTRRPLCRSRPATMGSRQPATVLPGTLRRGAGAAARLESLATRAGCRTSQAGRIPLVLLPSILPDTATAWPRLPPPLLQARQRVPHARA